MRRSEECCREQGDDHRSRRGRGLAGGASPRTPTKASGTTERLFCSAERSTELTVEHDACALVAIARKDGRATRDVLEQALHGLACLDHRSGTVDGEGDGAGILTDIPRQIWADHVGELAYDPHFALAHFFVPVSNDEVEEAAVRAILARRGLRIVAERHGASDPAALGRRARSGAPRSWQLGLFVPGSKRAGARVLHLAAADIERGTTATVVSLSRRSAVYKLRGSAAQLPRFYADLADPRFATTMAFGHNRYATNTTTSFERVQPFLALAHNGEINTIDRLRTEARSLRLPLSRDGSDSQDVDAVLRGLVVRFGLSLLEAVELLFPPIIPELRRMSGEDQDLYVQARAALGPLAQGPAAILTRVGDTCVFAVDALGLRPLWHVETADEHVFASERGFVPLSRYVADPRPLGPGERVALRRSSAGWELLGAEAVRERFVQARRARQIPVEGLRERLDCGGPADAPVIPRIGTGSGARSRWEVMSPPDEIEDPSQRREQQFAALGWEPDDLRMAKAMAETGAEPIGSLGYDGPLAALSERRPNLADFLHETVAVVTNPAIDREREIEHFSTRAIVGPRPSVRGGRSRPWIELRHPILLGGHAPETRLRGEDHRALARSLGTWIVEDIVARFTADAQRRPAILEADRDWEEHPRDALARLGAEACRAIRRGARLVLVQDRSCVEEGRAWLDPLLVVAAADRALREQPSRSGSLRRDCAVVVSAGSLRNLHDVMCALALGADAVNPYLLVEYALSLEDPDAVPNLIEAMRKGIEKVISTLGIHELRGYGRQLAAVGVAPDVARLLGLRSFCGGGAGLDWERIGEDGLLRGAMLRERTAARLEPAFRIYPRVWKAALAVANGEAPYSGYATRLEEFERAHPVSLRHLLDLRFDEALPSPVDRPLFAAEDGKGPIDAARAGAESGWGSARAGAEGRWGSRAGLASTRSGELDAPMYISSMSFGSQGETAYRAYAEAAFRLNILCVNGEGGELPDLLGRYPRNRGQQIASGRFGVSALLANSSDYLEIKIGQGAKPGEGGHLPARKVSAKVALARNSRPGVDLISPSNNHDIYSIEDLAQVVHELKTVNPRASVAVKVPVVADIGIIAVGIAKSGADVVTVSGYDGGTGAARQHALRRAGLPVEIGVAEAHRALVAAGLRDRVALSCDGGAKSALDVVKLMCLGADRVGFGTLAMVAIGCTICRGCQLDTCHVGITTQIETPAEAAARGVKRFEPQEFERAVQNLVRFFGAMREELAAITARLGLRRTRDLVGRTDLLVQARALDRVDLSDLLAPAEGWEVRVPAPVTVGADRAAVRSGGSGRDATASADLEALLIGGTAHEAVNGSEPRGMDQRGSGAIRAAQRGRRVGDPGPQRDAIEQPVPGGHAGPRVPNGPGGGVSRPGSSRPLTLDARDRFVGTADAGEMARCRIDGESPSELSLEFAGGSVAGNGYAAYATDGLSMSIAGGAQDGAAKTALGGTVTILKARNAEGRYVDGSVGKCFAYGAQRGRFLVQGGADARAAIRLSGAELLFGGELRGFAFEYMTGGRAVVLGDPGRWICSGMSGGTVYVRLAPERGLDENELRTRLAKGAKVAITAPATQDEAPLRELLSDYAAALDGSGQTDAAAEARALAADPGSFRCIRPAGEVVVDQTISTE